MDKHSEKLIINIISGLLNAESTLKMIANQDLTINKNRNLDPIISNIMHAISQLNNLTILYKGN